MRTLVTLLALIAGILATATPAQAHPLGNFTVNHYNGLRLYSDRVENTVIIDSAELPTLQERSAIDTNGDNTVSPPERAARATQECAQVTAAMTLRVSGAATTWRTLGTDLAYQPGNAGLETTRLTCRLSAPADLSGPAEIRFADSFRPGKIGWREITATGAGVAVTDSPVPSRSVSAELRRYPNDLLSSPLDQREARLQTRPGTGTDATAVQIPMADGLTRTMGALGGHLNSMIADRELTIPVGMLAVLLAALLGAGHAVLPGHGKTVIAAYLAGRRGRPRDAVTVGLTVTFTHTFGVLVLGLLLTASASLAGESVLAWLGIATGIIITTVGATLLRSTCRKTPNTQDHGHGHGHGHDHAHAHQSTPTSRRGLIGLGITGGLVPSPSALVVLLGAIALGRTAFGAGLVLAYGAGMAATLTIVGLLLVRFSDKLAAHTGGTGRLSRVSALIPVAAATLVILVGTGLTLRGLITIT